MSTRVEAFSVTDDAAHIVRFFSGGAQVSMEPPNVVGMGAGTFGYFFDVPASLAAGHYSYALYLTANGALRSQGEFDWDGSALVYGDRALTLAEVRAEIDAALSTYDAPTKSELDSGFAALQIPTTAEIEAALLDDGDNSSFKQALATVFEQHLQNDTDGEATLASFQGAVAAALSDYAAATTADVIAARDTLYQHVSGLEDLSVEDVEGALTNYSVARVADLPAALTTNQVRAEADAALVAYGTAKTAELAEGLDQAQVRTIVDQALTDYEVATRDDAGGTLTQADLTTAMDSLNDLSADDLSLALMAYGAATPDDFPDVLTSVDVRDVLTEVDPATSTALAEAVASLLDASGLTAEQLGILTFLRDIAESDEQYSTAAGKARRFIKGTNTVLVEKDLVTDSPAAVETTLTEPGA